MIMDTTLDPTKTFQNAVIKAVTEASQTGVHPAIVYTILGGLQNDVLMAIKQTNRALKPDDDTKLPEVNSAQ